MINWKHEVQINFNKSQGLGIGEEEFECRQLAPGNCAPTCRLGVALTWQDLPCVFFPGMSTLMDGKRQSSV